MHIMFRIPSVSNNLKCTESARKNLQARPPDVRYLTASCHERRTDADVGAMDVVEVSVDEDVK